MRVTMKMINIDLEERILFHLSRFKVVQVGSNVDLPLPGYSTRYRVVKVGSHVDLPLPGRAILYNGSERNVSF